MEAIPHPVLLGMGHSGFHRGGDVLVTRPPIGAGISWQVVVKARRLAVGAMQTGRRGTALQGTHQQGIQTEQGQGRPAGRGRRVACAGEGSQLAPRQHVNGVPGSMPSWLTVVGADSDGGEPITRLTRKKGRGDEAQAQQMKEPLPVLHAGLNARQFVAKACLDPVPQQEAGAERPGWRQGELAKETSKSPTGCRDGAAR